MQKGGQERILKLHTGQVLCDYSAFLVTILKKRGGSWKDKTKSPDLFEAKAKPKLILMV